MKFFLLFFLFFFVAHQELIEDYRTNLERDEMTDSYTSGVSLEISSGVPF